MTLLCKCMNLDCTHRHAADAQSVDEPVDEVSDLEREAREAGREAARRFALPATSRPPAFDGLPVGPVTIRNLANRGRVIE